MDGPELAGFGKLLVGAGLVLVAVGGLLLLGDRIPGLGRLPGDVTWKRGNLTFYAPIATSILLSIVLTIVLNLFLRR